jgi:transposase
MTPSRRSYPSDVSDDEWALVAPYLTLLREDAGQREDSLREVFNGLRYVVQTGAPWRWMPNDLPPWEAVYQQAQRWLAAGCFEQLADDLRALLRLASGRRSEHSAAILDSRTLRSTPESGERARPSWSTSVTDLEVRTKEFTNARILRQPAASVARSVTTTCPGGSRPDRHRPSSQRRRLSLGRVVLIDLPDGSDTHPRGYPTH